MVNSPTGIIIQARINSSRLPGKALLPLPQQGKKTILDHILEKAGLMQPLSQVILATSTNPENDILEQTAQKHQACFFRGEEQDVLSRYYQAAKKYHLHTIIRLTADNPFIDVDILSQTLRLHQQAQADYTLTAGLPLGTNLEIFSFQALETAFLQALLPEHREHVTPFIRLNPQRFALHQLDWSERGYGKADWRLTIDNESDYALACAIFLALGTVDALPSLTQVTELLTNNPALLAINQHHYQKKVFANLREEVAEATRLLQFYDLNQAAEILRNYPVS